MARFSTESSSSKYDFSGHVRTARNETKKGISSHETDKNRNDYFGYIGRKLITSEIVVIAKL